MASKRPQTIAKRTRELAVKERRERKRAKKAEAAAQRAAGGNPPADGTTDPTLSPVETADARVPASGPNETS
jgi:hypothetical protein